MLNNLRKSPKIDCILVNEDIYEKLSLVEYHKYFCKPLGYKPVSKVYFAIKETQISENEEKFYYFSELCHWIMILPKVNYQI